MAKCKICEEDEIDKFYKSDLKTCKECIKKRARQYRKDNIEKVKKYDRNRPNANERAKKHADRISKLREIGSTKYDDYIQSKREWGQKNRHKRNAQQQAERALFKGKIIKPLNCEHCKEEIKLQGHHPDYLKPLEVVWLCTQCHAKEHVRLRKIERENK